MTSDSQRSVMEESVQFILPQSKGPGSKTVAEVHKHNGNKLLKKGNFKGAVTEYSFAIDAFTSDDKTSTEDGALYYSNRSMAYYKMCRYQEALADADEAIKMRPSWSKGYSRRSNALMKLCRFKDAVSTCEEGIACADKKEILEESLISLKKCYASEKILTKLIIGKWYGTKQDRTYGQVEQEFTFESNSKVILRVMGKNHHCTYKLHTDEKVDGGFRMSLCMPTPINDSLGTKFGTDPSVDVLPFLIKIDGPDLLLCAPDITNPTDANFKPEKFDGFGFVRYSKTEPMWKTQIAKMNKREKIFYFLQEFTARIPKPAPESYAEDVSKQWNQAALLRIQIRLEMLKQRFGTDICSTGMNLLTKIPLGTQKAMKEIALTATKKLNLLTDGKIPLDFTKDGLFFTSETVETNEALSVQNNEVSSSNDVSSETKMGSPTKKKKKRKRLKTKRNRSRNKNKEKHKSYFSLIGSKIAKLDTPILIAGAAVAIAVAGIFSITLMREKKR